MVSMALTDGNDWLSADHHTIYALHGADFVSIPDAKPDEIYNIYSSEGGDYIIIYH